MILWFFSLNLFKLFLFWNLWTRHKYWILSFALLEIHIYEQMWLLSVISGDFEAFLLKSDDL